MALRPPAGLHPGPRVCAAHCTCANPISDKPSVLGAAYVPGAWGTVLGGMAAICCCDGAVMVGLRPMVGARPKVGLRCMDFCLRRGTDTATGVQARAAGSCPPREGCQAVGGCARGGGVPAACMHHPPVSTARQVRAVPVFAGAGRHAQPMASAAGCVLACALVGLAPVGVGGLSLGIRAAGAADVHAAAHAHCTQQLLAVGQLGADLHARCDVGRVGAVAASRRQCAAPPAWAGQGCIDAHAAGAGSAWRVTACNTGRAARRRPQAARTLSKSSSIFSICWPCCCRLSSVEA